VLLFVVPAAYADSPRQDLQQADQSVLQARAALARGDTDAARQSYQSFRDRWVQIEDGVKDASASDYAAIETAMRAVRVSLTAQPFAGAARERALDGLHGANAAFCGAPAGAGGQPSPADDAARLQALVDTLGEARDAVVRRDASAALAEVKSFEKEWPAS